jgi:hypothetical protein
LSMASATGANFEIQVLAPIVDGKAIAYKTSSSGQNSMQNHLSLLFYFRHVHCSGPLGPKT